MASLSSKNHGKKLSIFLNISFLILLCFFLIIHFHPPNSHTLIVSSSSQNYTNNETCIDIHNYKDYKAKCEFLKSTNICSSQGYIDYLNLFYCKLGRYPILGYTILILWLVILFYILGNTAANYFCSSLESLSRVLKLSPTIAGVTLLSLGNGANDVFSSIVSFMGDGTGGVGLNSILGGAFFISCVVVGVISISRERHQVSVHKFSFIRDVMFLILSLCSLLVILIIGKINIWGAIGFVSLYFVYVLIVSTTHLWGDIDAEDDVFDVSPILPITKIFEDKLCVPLLDHNMDAKPRSEDSSSWFYFGKILYILELPLYLPRRLTIPVVSEERWSKSCGVISVTLAPVLLAVLWNSRNANVGTKTSIVIDVIGGLIGMILGTVAFVKTKSSRPPKTCLLPWLLGGFLMSITWSYIVAEELVSLIVSLGNVFGINPSILGLTLLAWGNSLGDLIANGTMAMNGGPDGVQIAISGCYAGPIFNTVVGLGLSMVFSCWSEYPSSYIIPKDNSLYETIGFLIGGLLWALVILPRKNMKLDSVFGGGLLSIYLCFLSVRMVQTLGIVQL